MSERCVVCSIVGESLHHHHVIPSAFGGRDGPQVVLCGTCHTNVHSHALAILSYQKSGGKNKLKNFWSNPNSEQNAIPLVNAIVHAASNFDGDKSYKMVCEFDSDTYSKLRHIKKDLALASLEAALLYSVSNVFERYCTNNNTNNGNADEKKRIRLW